MFLNCVRQILFVWQSHDATSLVMSPSLNSHKAPEPAAGHIGK